MENKDLIINCINIGKKIYVPRGTSLMEISKELNIQSTYPLIVAKVNNKTEPLDYCVYRNKTIEFKSIDSLSGWRAYVRSLFFLMAKSVNELFPKANLCIEHSLSNGYYCKISAFSNPSKADIEKIKEKMKFYVEKNLPLKHNEIETKDLIDIFEKQGFNDKVTLLKTIKKLYSTYYELDGYYDNFYSCLVPSTCYLDTFDLKPYKDGMILLVPDKQQPATIRPFVDQPKLFNAYREQLDFLDILGINDIGELNLAIEHNKISSIIRVAEAMQEKNISNIAENIAKKAKEKGLKVVMIAGPSSSGKTTFRMRLEVQLLTNLIRPVGLSLDDYFVNRIDTPRDETGDYDYESLYALDLEKFNKDLIDLLEGRPVQLPSYNFKTGEREYKEGNELILRDGDVLVIEGIHGLNPELTSSIRSEECIYKIYVSALTTISMDKHNLISTSDNRLLRRIIRDYKFRNYSAIDTISRWQKVRAGEDKWIFPYQENANIMFNSAMIYELAAMRKFAEPILKQVPNDSAEYSEAYRLLNFLSYFHYINDTELPPTSLLREFLGGSSFEYS